MNAEAFAPAAATRVSHAAGPDCKNITPAARHDVIFRRLHHALDFRAFPEGIIVELAEQIG
jgi:hypothetical protein